MRPAADRAHFKQRVHLFILLLLLLLSLLFLVLMAVRSQAQAQQLEPAVFSCCRLPLVMNDHLVLTPCVNHPTMQKHLFFSSTKQLFLCLSRVCLGKNSVLSSILCRMALKRTSPHRSFASIRPSAGVTPRHKHTYVFRTVCPLKRSFSTSALCAQVGRTRAPAETSLFLSTRLPMFVPSLSWQMFGFYSTMVQKRLCFPHRLSVDRAG